ncbi:hypothetical protein B9Z19DRAFT_1097174 [Tuber borchii]|uniref:Uncharacterized protein n=1 Tax=Tuber borchii TaxID=42251 RepID=A0A2T6ZAL1_TUBBO|nr:hypothetical protein B9Z19DRAFT_1097174 [Tuber borchii]
MKLLPRFRGLRILLTLMLLQVCLVSLLMRMTVVMTRKKTYILATGIEEGRVTSENSSGRRKERGRRQKNELQRRLSR